MFFGHFTGYSTEKIEEKTQPWIKIIQQKNQMAKSKMSLKIKSFLSLLKKKAN